MIYIEMARDEDHGGGWMWAFTNCVWAPVEKRNGSSWPCWNKVVNIKEGDTILHLRGKPPNAQFVGFSKASSNGFISSRHPPNPGEWGYASAFF